MSLVNTKVDSTKNVPRITIINQDRNIVDCRNPVFLELAHHLLNPSINEINIPKLTIVNPAGIRNLIG